MKIQKLEVTNFRNLTKIDTTFGEINIITGRNSSGKTNLTQLLGNCLYTLNPYDFGELFNNNIVTHGIGINSTTIKSTIDFGNIKSRIREEIVGGGRSIKHYRSLEGESEYTIKTIKGIPGDPIYMKSIERKGIGYEYDEKFEIKKSNKNYLYTKDFSNKNNNSLTGITSGTANRSNDLEFNIFTNNIIGKIITFDDKYSFSNTCSNIYKFVTGNNTDGIRQKDNGLQALERIKNNKQSFASFDKSEYIYILADIQKNEANMNILRDDLKYFSDGILRSIKINDEGKNGSKGDIYIDSPNGPKNIEYISSGTAILLYFITLKNRLNLNQEYKSYKNPEIMIFDELDSAIHPGLMDKFSSLLKYISKDIQLFITSHSTNFIDQFDKKDIYLLKDNGSFSEKVKLKSNILSYQDIIDSLDTKKLKNIYNKLSNGELYINGYIDSLFPILNTK